ncbi:MAG: hypothetical protein AAGI71_03950 [Bacteroidota bacterium]
MTRRHPLLLLTLLTGLSLNLACSDSPASDDLDRPAPLLFDFREGTNGWTAGFADYPPGEEDFYELEAGLAMLPASLDETRQAFRISSSNRSDDVFMFLKRRLDDLAPNTTYATQFRVEFASDGGIGCAGIGGAPGEAVAVKAGASALEPAPRVDETVGLYRMNVDKGDQSQPGQDALVLGHVAVDVPCQGGTFKLKTLTSEDGAFSARTDAQGQLWLLVGTDSGYEGITTLYYTQIEVQLEPM